MGKAAVLPELVEWYTFSSNNENACVGCFSDDANRNTILNEIIDAPVDEESLSSRTALYKAKKDIETNPSAKGYSESKIIILTNKELDPVELNDLPYKLDIENTKNLQENIEKNSPLEFKGKTYKYLYQFKVNTTEQVA